MKTIFFVVIFFFFSCYVRLVSPAEFKWCTVKVFQDLITPFRWCDPLPKKPIQGFPTNTCVQASPILADSNDKIDKAAFVSVSGNTVFVSNWYDKFSNCDTTPDEEGSYTVGECFHVSLNRIYARIDCFEDFPITIQPDEEAQKSFFEYNTYLPGDNCSSTQTSQTSILLRINTCSSIQKQHNATHDKFDYQKGFYDMVNNRVALTYYYDSYCTKPMMAQITENITLNDCIFVGLGSYVKFKYFPTKDSLTTPWVTDDYVVNGNKYSYLVFGYYYTDLCELEPVVDDENVPFVGKSVVPLNRCNNYAIKYANDNGLSMFFYHEDDLLCNNNFTHAVSYQLNFSNFCDEFIPSEGSSGYGDLLIFWGPSATDDSTYYIGSYFTSNLNHLKQYVTINRYVCGNHSDEKEQKLRMRYSDFSTYLHDDICVAFDTPTISPGYHTSLRGNCRGGDMTIKNYTVNQQCEGMYNVIKDELCIEVTDMDHINVRCTQYWCDGISEFSSSVCSFQGECIDFDKCMCNEGYTGKYCDKIIPPPWYADSVFMTILVSICVISVTATLLTLVIVVILVCLVFTLIKIKDYKQIEDIDILLNESRASRRGDKNRSIAHLKIDRKKFVINYEDLKISKKIGEGGSNSAVYLATYHNSPVAFKCFQTSDICSTQESFDEFEKEVAILANVKHPFILNFIGATIKPPRVGILTEYCDRGDLKGFLEKNPEYSIRDRIRILGEVASAMAYLHSKDIIHRDLKCENVLLTKGIEARVMDFGLSKIVNKISSSNKTKRVGTSYYMAPEMVKSGSDYNELVDVFSFAILSWEVVNVNFNPYGSLTGKKNTSSYNMEVKVANNPDLRPPIRDEIFEGIEWLKGIIESSWSHVASSRPSFLKIVDSIKKNTNDGNLKRPVIPDSMSRSKSSVEVIQLKKKVEELEKRVEIYENKFGKL